MAEYEPSVWVQTVEQAERLIASLRADIAKERRYHGSSERLVRSQALLRRVRDIAWGLRAQESQARRGK